MQYLASDGDAPRLHPTDIPIISYILPIVADGSKMHLANISIVGPQAHRPVLQLFKLLGASCDLLMANAAVQAKIKVLAVSKMCFMGCSLLYYNICSEMC